VAPSLCFRSRNGPRGCLQLRGAGPNDPGSPPRRANLKVPRQWVAVGVGSSPAHAIGAECFGPEDSGESYNREGTWPTEVWISPSHRLKVAELGGRRKRQSASRDSPSEWRTADGIRSGEAVAGVAGIRLERTASGLFETQYIDRKMRIVSRAFAEGQRLKVGGILDVYSPKASSTAPTKTQRTLRHRLARPLR
jgi:hypothetical protein